MSISFEKIFWWIVGFAFVAFFYQIVYPRLSGHVKNAIEPFTNPEGKLRSMHSTEWAQAARTAFVPMDPFEESGSKGERFCRKYLENRFGKPFVKSRPEFLRHPKSGQYLELDCFNQELRLAVEYNGRQHYEFVPFFHRTIDDFHAMQERDATKSELCRHYGVSLIVVPYSHLSQEYLDAKLAEIGMH